MGSEDVDNVVHAAELLVELAAFHRRVLLALEMREELVDNVDARARRHGEHPALCHQLSEAEAPEEGGLAALVGAGDNNQAFAIARDVVANRAIVQAQREGNVSALYGEDGEMSVRCEVGGGPETPELRAKWDSEGCTT
jgi:hypothetical protein